MGIGLPPGLGSGSYVVAWRVISDDGHPVHGAYVFSVGTDRGAVRAAVVAGALATESGSPGVGAVAGFLRWAALAGLLTLVGLAVLVAVVWPDGGPTTRVRRILWASWGVLLVATVVGIAVEGVYAALLPLGDVLRPSLVEEVLRTRFGRAEVARLVLLVAFVPVLVGVGRRIVDDGWRRRWLLPSISVLGLGLLVTTGLAGHAATGGAPASDWPSTSSTCRPPRCGWAASCCSPCSSWGGRRRSRSPSTPVPSSVRSRHGSWARRRRSW